MPLKLVDFSDKRKEFRVKDDGFGIDHDGDHPYLNSYVRLCFCDGQRR
jgi:hypothetical protein